jgi:hypothetical protein
VRNKKTQYGWHFISKGMRLAYRDGRKVNLGDRVEFKPREGIGTLPRLCYQGMHASFTVRNAMRSAGKRICLVKVEHDIVGNPRTSKKFAGRYRTILWSAVMPDKVWTFREDESPYGHPDKTVRLRRREARLLKWVLDKGCPPALLKKAGVK